MTPQSTTPPGGVTEKMSLTSKSMEKNSCYALEIPYSKQNHNFKRRVTRLGRDLIVMGLLVCLLRTNCVSQWMYMWTGSEKPSVEGSSWTLSWRWAYKNEEHPRARSVWIKCKTWFLDQLLDWLDISKISKLWRLAMKGIKFFIRESIIWVEFVEDHLPDVGATLLIVGCFLSLVGTSLILRDNWIVLDSMEKDLCVRCLADRKDSELEAKNDEIPRNVELAKPIFKFIKVYPYHKKFPGTSDFSLKTAKMRLIIMFNRSTQT